ncbi:MAG: N-formylglutamate amidohydrolase [Hyphomicrobiales bacterium]|nr:N-formylglutamate amidohydrolase [Hyphomicrobiales bacterium]
MAPDRCRHYHCAMDMVTTRMDDAKNAAERFASYVTIAGDPAYGLILLCDHAENRLPAEYGTLGLPPAEFERHIAYDPGAGAVTRGLAERLGAPAALTTFSRLLIDPNRSEDDPTLIMRLSDGAIVPGNHRVDAAERQRRLERYYAPYHAAVEGMIDRSIAAGVIPALVSVHSFTPLWRGRARPWQIGILWDADPRLSLPMVEHLAADRSLLVGDNEPYSGALIRDSMYRHGTRRGLAHALIELRQDLIADEAGAAAWVDRLAPVMADLNALPDIHEIRHHGSRTGPVEPL